MDTHIYHCSNKQCREYHKEIRTMSPVQDRIVGVRLNCPNCQKPLYFKGFVHSDIKGGKK